MTSSPSAAWLSGIAAPLTERFGADLTLSRTGDMVCWDYDGKSAIVELTSAGTMRATFIDCESIDAVSRTPAAAAYRTSSTYALNRPSCSRMVADMVDFFSGVREPKFIFVDAYPR
jgi:hypothetical protein